MKTLVLVDIQNDFVPGGALAVPSGDEVVAVANRLLSHFDLVVATQDWHPAQHGSFASQHAGHDVGEVIELDGLPQVLWPDHCVQRSWGAELVEELHTDGIHHVVQKGTDMAIDSYSGFFDNGHRQATGLSALLRERHAGPLYVMGLATDYCVQFTALDAIREGFETFLIQDGCRGVNLHPGDVEAALESMRGAGVTLVTSAEVLEGR